MDHIVRFHKKKHQTRLLGLTSSDIAVLPTHILHLPWESQDMLTIFDSIQCYNQTVVSTTKCLPPALRRNSIQDDIPWHLLPLLLRHTFILTFRTLHAAEQGNDSLSCSVISRYRSLGLEQLRQQLSTAVDDPYGVALSAILLLLGADITVSADGSWIVHFNAARKLIALRGGIQFCLDTNPTLRDALLDFMLVDIFTALTCHSGQIFPNSLSSEEHSTYLSIISGSDACVIAKSCACPPEILQAIVRTNLLRTNSQALELNLNLTQRTEFEDILHTIERFGVDHWAIRLLSIGVQQPARIADVSSTDVFTAISLVASLYQFAALIYLLRSCFHIINQSTQLLIQATQQNIQDQITALCDEHGYQNNAELQKQILRRLEWPMFVSAYETIGWNAEEDSKNACLQQFQTIANKTGSRRLHDALKHLRNVHYTRNMSPSSSWSWDLGFTTRCAYGL